MDVFELEDIHKSAEFLFSPLVQLRYKTHN